MRERERERGCHGGHGGSRRAAPGSSAPRRRRPVIGRRPGRPGPLSQDPAPPRGRSGVYDTRERGREGKRGRAREREREKDPPLGFGPILRGALLQARGCVFVFGVGSEGGLATPDKASPGPRERHAPQPRPSPPPVPGGLETPRPHPAPLPPPPHSVWRAVGSPPRTPGCAGEHGKEI